MPEPSLTELVNTVRQSRGPRCAIEKIRADMTKPQRAELDGLLADHTIPATSLTAALRGLGRTVGVDSVARHRRRVCSCPR